jgi:hypothetical protein
MNPVEFAGAALAIAACATVAAAQAPQRQINTLNELGATLRACWIPPPLDQARVGMQVTVQMTFRRNGELFGKPRIAFESSGASDDERLVYRVAVAEMLKRCAPLPFTDALGNAVAGRPFTMRLVDDRKLKQAENAS